MKYIPLITAATSVALALATAAPAFAEDTQQPVTGSGSVSAGVRVHAEDGADGGSDDTSEHNGLKVGLPHLKFMASTTAHLEGKGGHATSTQNRIDNGQQRGDNMIDQRIKSLQDLLNRISQMKLLSADQLASIQASINAEIQTLTDLKAKIGTDTSTTTVKADDASITKANRVYLVVMPKAHIAAAADRINAVVTQMQTLATKLQARITTAQTAGVDVTSATAALTDFNAKTADAKTQADAAVAETVNLQADNGDATIKASNTATLKDAEAKLKTAQGDLQAARADAKTIVGVVKGK